MSREHYACEIDAERELTVDSEGDDVWLHTKDPETFEIGAGVVLRSAVDIKRLTKQLSDWLSRNDCKKCNGTGWVEVDVAIVPCGCK